MQESLTNIHRYANSPTAIIRVNVDAEEMTLEIIDHGKGMEVSAEAPETFSAERPGVGIQGMRERMRQLSGRLEIVWVPDRGTRIIAILPIEGLAREPVLDEADTADDVAADESAARDNDSAPLRSAPDKKVRVLIADDHEIMRQGVRTLLAGELNWEVCGEAVNGREAVEKTFQLSPDLVILDLNMPVLDGLAALREIVAQSPRAKVLVLTVHDSERIIHEIFAAGADGCLLKSPNRPGPGPRRNHSLERPTLPPRPHQRPSRPGRSIQSSPLRIIAVIAAGARHAVPGVSVPSAFLCESPHRAIPLGTAVPVEGCTLC